MMGRTIRTKIPQLIKSLDNKADLEEARQQDQQTRLRRKELRDQRKTAKEKDYKMQKVMINTRRVEKVKKVIEKKKKTATALV